MEKLVNRKYKVTEFPECIRRGECCLEEPCEDMPLDLDGICIALEKQGEKYICLVKHFTIGMGCPLKEIREIA